MRTISSSIEVVFDALRFIHGSLSWLTTYNDNCFMVEETIIEDWEFKELIDFKWGNNLLRDSTIDKLKEFRLKWLEYKREVSFGDELTFAFLDKRWIDIIDQYLVPALESMEEDFHSKGYKPDFYHSEVYNTQGRPNSEDVLERIDFLYKKLLKKGLVSKDYLVE